MVKRRDEVTWFSTSDEWQAWLLEHHDTATDLWVGLRKKHVPNGIVYAEALDAALCFGWIDGVTHTVDADGYTIRFSPRKPKSIWSAVNLKRMEELQAEGLLADAGRLAWESRDPAREGLYSHEQEDLALDVEAEARFREREAAWTWFETQPPGYQRQAIWWVISAKRPETKERRLITLIEDSANERRLAHLRR
jgi:uncharacterized protein YdeI (YjbR/CyaY-like superfamily)